MLGRAGLFATLVLVGSAPGIAATEAECLSLWKSADVNANGALTVDEDKSGYIAAAEKGGRSLVKPGTVSRDEFLQLCQQNVFVALQTATGEPATKPMDGPAASRDLGKGDLTPALTALPEEVARKKLNETGFKDVQDLKLDSENVWRATALVNGQRQDVAIDAQGDIIGKPSPSAQTPGPLGQAPNPAAAGDQGGASGISAAAGDSGSGGMLLWTFLLIGNAIGLFVLSQLTSGGTSAMASRTTNPFV